MKYLGPLTIFCLWGGVPFGMVEACNGHFSHVSCSSSFKLLHLYSNGDLVYPLSLAFYVIQQRLRKCRFSGFRNSDRGGR